MRLFPKPATLPNLAPRIAPTPGAGILLKDYGKPVGLYLRLTATDPDEHGVKEFAGLRLLEPPTQVILPRTTIQRGIREGYVTVTEPTMVYLHTGPPEDPTRQVEAVEHYKYVTFHTLDGDVTYEVTQNPGREDKAYYGRAI